MSTALLGASALTFLIGLVHSWLGERRLIGPLLDPGSRQGLLARSRFARSVLRFAWHITTIAWWGFGAMLAGLALAPAAHHGKLALAATATTMLATGIVILVAGRGRHLAWPAFLAIAGLAALPLLAPAT
jgi:hypothetical protein